LTQACATFDDWTEEETGNLLEALTCAGEEWDVVAQLVKTKTMQQCVLQFARLPIADRYLQDYNPSFHEPPDTSTLASLYGPARSVSQLAAAAFPEEWSPEWAGWLQSLARAPEVETAALGPALGAALAALDGTLCEGGDASASNSSAADAGRGEGDGEEGQKAAAAAAAAAARNSSVQDDYEMEEARPSPDHPWMSVLQWTAPGGRPRIQVKESYHGLCSLALECVLLRMRP